eukprot:scaffold1582_cov93-Cylindrotheca_fusiformis.AAC.3
MKKSRKRHQERTRRTTASNVLQPAADDDNGLLFLWLRHKEHEDDAILDSKECLTIELLCTPTIMNYRHFGAMIWLSVQRVATRFSYILIFLFDQNNTLSQPAANLLLSLSSTVFGISTTNLWYFWQGIGIPFPTEQHVRENNREIPITIHDEYKKKLAENCTRLVKAIRESSSYERDVLG